MYNTLTYVYTHYTYRYMCFYNYNVLFLNSECCEKCVGFIMCFFFFETNADEICEGFFLIRGAKCLNTYLCTAYERCLVQVVLMWVMQITPQQ